MHQCEFCNAMFVPRRQVKKPRACEKCQGRRQRENEKAWHNRHKGLYDRKYHSIRKTERGRKLKAVAEKLLELLRVGKALLGETFDSAELGLLLHQFLVRCGIRKVNKLWLLGTS